MLDSHGICAPLQKRVTQRTAEASATVYLGETAFRLVQVLLCHS
jgi:hypothetical protein